MKRVHRCHDQSITMSLICWRRWAMLLALLVAPTAESCADAVFNYTLQKVSLNLQANSLAIETSGI